MTQRSFLQAIGVLLFLSLGAVLAHSEEETATKEKDVKIYSAAEEQDVSVGSETAPVHMVEFLSIGCPHCVEDWFKLRPQLMELVEKGTLRLSYHEIFYTDQSFAATAFLRCMPTENYLDILDSLMTNIHLWSGQPDKRAAYFETMAKKYNQKWDEVNACAVSDKTKKMLEKRKKRAASVYSVKQVPTYQIIGTPYSFVSVRDTDEILKAVYELTGPKYEVKGTLISVDVPEPVDEPVQPPSAPQVEETKKE